MLIKKNIPPLAFREKMIYQIAYFRQAETVLARHEKPSIAKPSLLQVFPLVFIPGMYSWRQL
jgi:hypothetical protein